MIVLTVIAQSLGEGCICSMKEVLRSKHNVTNKMAISSNWNFWKKKKTTNVHLCYHFRSDNSVVKIRKIEVTINFLNAQFKKYIALKYDLLYPYFPISLCPYIRMSLYPYIPISVSIYTPWITKFRSASEPST